MTTGNYTVEFSVSVLSFYFICIQTALKVFQVKIQSDHYHDFIC